MALNQGTLDGLVNAALAGEEIDTAKLIQILGMISNKLFGINEPVVNTFPTLTPTNSIITEARGVKFPLAKVDANGIISLGQPASGVGTGYIKFPSPPTDAVLAGSKALNGVFYVSQSAANLIFYYNGARYFVAGTAF